MRERIQRDHKRWRVSLWPMASIRFLYIQMNHLMSQNHSHTHSQPTNLADVCCVVSHLHIDVTLNIVLFIGDARSRITHSIESTVRHTLLSIHRIYAVASVYSPYAFVILLCQLEQVDSSLGTASANLTKSIPKPLVFALCQKPFARLY